MNKERNLKNIVATTFTPMYDQVEDRIRVVVNYSDINNRIDFMFTRNIIIDFIPQIDQYILNHYNTNNNKIIEIDTSFKNMRAEDIFEPKHIEQTDNTDLNLLHLKNELLVKIDISYQVNTQLSLLTLTSHENIANAQLNGEMLKQLVESIKNTIPKYRWGISYYF